MIGINGTSMVPTPEHVRHHLIHMPNTFLQHLSLQPFGKSSRILLVESLKGAPLECAPDLFNIETWSIFEKGYQI